MCRVWRNCRESRGRAGDVTVTSAQADSSLLCSVLVLVDHTATATVLYNACFFSARDLLESLVRMM